MFQTIVNAWRVKEIRHKILFTLFILLIFRVGSAIPVPFIDVTALSSEFSSNAGSFLNYMSVLTGGAMNYGALFAMSITPYINASIILQLLTVAIPYLERVAKEGEEGRRKIAKYTRYATFFLALIQGGAYFWWLKASGYVDATGLWESIFAGVVIVLCFTAGAVLLMWLGERIDEKGVGNGISMILFAGIISRFPQAVVILVNTFKTNIVGGIAILVSFILVVLFVIFMQAGERRIPIQYAKRVVGRKQYGGQNTHMPIKVNMSGVLPIIFASSILTVPMQILQFMPSSSYESTIYRLLGVVDYNSWSYALIYFALIIAFAFFYTSMQYNPVEMANNLRKNSGGIPGIRPGKPTQDFIQKIISRITLIGAIFLGVVAVLPIIVGLFIGQNVSLGGTSLLIVVGVALDTVQQLESQLMMRHYKGFLD